jgi:hypothetical protein
VGAARAGQSAHQQAEQPDTLVNAEHAPAQRAHQLEQNGVTVVVVRPCGHCERHREQVAQEGADEPLGDVTGLVGIVCVIELGQRLGERLRRLGQPCIANVLIDPWQIRAGGADPGGRAQRAGQLERGAKAIRGALGQRALEHAVERRGKAAAELGHRGLAVQLGELGHRRALEGTAARQRLEGDHGKRVEIRRGPDRDRIAPLLGRDVRRRPNGVVVLGQLDVVALRRRRIGGHRRSARRGNRALARGVIARRQGQVADLRHALRAHRAVEQLGDAEVEQLGQ